MLLEGVPVRGSGRPDSRPCCSTRVLAVKVVGDGGGGPEPGGGYPGGRHRPESCPAGGGGASGRVVPCVGALVRPPGRAPTGVPSGVPGGGPRGEGTTIIPATVTTYSASSRVVRVTINGMLGTRVAGLAPGQKVDLGDWRAETLRWDELEDDQVMASVSSCDPGGLTAGACGHSRTRRGSSWTSSPAGADVGVSGGWGGKLCDQDEGAV